MSIARDMGAAAPSIILITGAMAAGKSSVAQALAQRLDRSMHLRGDVFRRMIVSGRADMTATPSGEALRQLKLRYRAACAVGSIYCRAGFTVVYQDTILGSLLGEVLGMYEGVPLHAVVLCPSERVIEQRELARGKKGYGSVTVAHLQQALAETPRVGLWIDNSAHTVDETAKEILTNLPAARVTGDG